MALLLRHVNLCIVEWWDYDATVGVFIKTVLLLRGLKEDFDGSIDVNKGTACGC